MSSNPPYKILLVEDNAGDVKLVQEALRDVQLRFELTHCETVKSAVQAISRYADGGIDIPDLILLDYNLPGGDARDVLKAALANAALARTKKAVITSSLSPRDRDEALQSGAQYVLQKPAELDSFLRHVGEAVVKLLGSE